MNRVLIIFVIIVLTFAKSVYAQVAINTSGDSPDNSAILDINASDKGLLIPRVALQGTDDNSTISSPATGLMVYNTATTSDVVPGFYFFNGSKWEKLGTGSYTFTNGLTENSSHSVGLGGTLANNTTINFGVGSFGNVLYYNLVGSSSQFIIQDDGVDNVIFSNDGNIEFKGNISAGEYYNFGGTFGSTGYGIRTKTGTLQYRRTTSEDWTDFPEAVSGTPYWWYRPTDSTFIRPQNNDNIRIYDDNETYGLYFDGGTNQFGGFFRTTGSYSYTAAVVGFSDVAGNQTKGYLGYDGKWTSGSGDFDIDGMAVFGEVEDRGRASVFGATTRDATYAAIIGYSDVWIAGYYYTLDVNNTSKSHPALYGQLLVNTEKSGIQAALETWSEYEYGSGNRGVTTGADITAMGHSQSSIGINTTAHSYGSDTYAYGLKVDVDSADYMYGLFVNAGGTGVTSTKVYGAFLQGKSLGSTGLLAYGNDAQNIFVSGKGDGVIGISDAGFGVFGQFDDGSGNLNNYGILGHDVLKANYFYHNETTTDDGQSAGYFYRARTSQNDGSNYWHNGTNQAVEGYNLYGDSYTFGVSGFSWADGNGRTGGVLGGLYDGSSVEWGSLGYEAADGTMYGGYFSTYTGENGSGKNSVKNNIGIGVKGGVMGGWFDGDVYGATIRGNRYALYVDGTTYTNDNIITLTDNGKGKRVVSYVTTSDEPVLYLSGVAELKNGKAEIRFPAEYQTIIDRSKPIIVTVSPLGQSNGLYLVATKSTGFSVAENAKGKSNIKFNWIAVVHKKTSESDIPAEVLNSDFDNKIDGLMTEKTPFWWDGALQTDKKPSKKIVAKKVESIHSEKISDYKKFQNIPTSRRNKIKK